MKKRDVAGIIAVPVALGALIFGMSAVIPQAAPEPTESPSIVRLLSDEAERPTETPTPTAEPAAPVDPAPAPDAEPEPAPEPPAPPAPILCPPGSTANSNDGYNDTSCFPDVCFTIPVPDPAYPECDVAFRP